MPKIAKQSAVPRPQVNGMAEHVADVEDGWSTSSYLQLLLYGEAGSGKTVFWATFPGSILVLVCSGGRRPEELDSIDTPENRKRIKPKVITSTDKLREILEKDVPKYDLTVLDHITGLQDQDLKEVMGITEIPAVKAWGFAVQEQYGAVARHCIEYVRELKNQAKNLVVVGQEKIFDSKQDSGSGLGKPKVSVSVMPSLRTWLEPAFSNVLHMFTRPVMVKQAVEVDGQAMETSVRGEGIEHCLRLQEHELYKVKLRRSSRKPLPECLVNPTWDKLVKAIKG